jgi:hypothetical protein
MNMGSLLADRLERLVRNFREGCRSGSKEIKKEN